MSQPLLLPLDSAPVSDLRAAAGDALSVKGLRKTYSRAFRRGGSEALRGVDLRVPRGSAFGLIGPNGAGKTTFIKSLLGIVRPTAGEVLLLGGSPEDPRIRARIGYLPERLHLPGSWSATAFLATVRRLKGLGPDAAGSAKLLERVGLAEAAGRRIGGYSKGMRQRLGLAAALLGEPELLVLDEPTDGVDPLGRAEIRELLSEERARGATLFLNSHLLSETERMCDRIGILAQGQIVREGSVAELCGTQGSWRARFAAARLAPEQLAQELSSLGFTALPDGSFSVAADTPVELEQRLGAARERGALLIELRPAARDLESVLAEVLGR